MLGNKYDALGKILFNYSREIVGLRHTNLPTMEFDTVHIKGLLEELSQYTDQTLALETQFQSNKEEQDRTNPPSLRSSREFFFRFQIPDRNRIDLG